LQLHFSAIHIDWVGTAFATVLCDYRVKQSEKEENPKKN
jgi:hypothetical protein